MRLMTLFFIAALTVAGGPANTAGPGHDGNAEGAIREIEREVLAAATRRDPAAFERFLADDYISTDGVGQVASKAQTISNVGSAGYTVESIDQRDVRVRVYAGAALVTGLNHVKTRLSDGQQVDVAIRYLHMYVKQDQGWKIVAAQATLVPR
jgi:ketosteroid isomerase-like protein